MDDSTISPSSSINPLVSRLDRLDFIMKYLERRTKIGQESDNTNRANSGEVIERPDGFIPMDLALKEAQSNGPLVDRVAVLESRLFQVKRAIQICLEMDQSSGTSGTSSSGTSSQTSGDTFSLRSRESNCPLPTFNNPRMSQVHVMTTTNEIEEKSDEEEQNFNPGPPRQKTKKNKKQKEDSKSGMKKNTPSWLHMKLLGC